MCLTLKMLQFSTLKGKIDLLLFCKNVYTGSFQSDISFILKVYQELPVDFHMSAWMRACTWARLVLLLMLRGWGWGGWSAPIRSSIHDRSDQRTFSWESWYQLWFQFWSWSWSGPARRSRAAAAGDTGKNRDIRQDFLSKSLLFRKARDLNNARRFFEVHQVVFSLAQIPGGSGAGLQGLRIWMNSCRLWTRTGGRNLQVSERGSVFSWSWTGSICRDTGESTWGSGHVTAGLQSLLIRCDWLLVSRPLLVFGAPEVREFEREKLF